MDLGPASYVITLDGQCGMIGAKPPRGDMVEVHLFMGRERDSRINTQWLNARQLTQVSAGTWTECLNERYRK